MNELGLIAELLVTDPSGRKPVFTHYNPYLLSWPMKLVLQSRDHSQLGQAMAQFSQTYKYCDFIVVGSRLFIEFVPNHLHKIIDQMPVDSWEINQYRVRLGIRRPSNISMVNNRS